ncbi:uncharacterized protein LOC119615527 [Lucilia sericata]|uniref:uncharacterized protein LOC119615527 n=1 Tax=Lucilia sericata TaxID=13632 RepID=UPI0018A86B91|nr:uncharacterized protein LOC119615527 [Lucilia sericata]
MRIGYNRYKNKEVMPSGSNQKNCRPYKYAESLSFLDKFRNTQAKKLLPQRLNHPQKSSQVPNRDEADIYGESWIVTYRKLAPDQKVLAKRLIDETLVFAELGQLAVASSIDTGENNITPTFDPNIKQQSNTTNPTLSSIQHHGIPNRRSSLRPRVLSICRN